MDPSEDDQICFIYHLKPGCGEEYDRLHAQIPPEIVDRIRARGTHDYSIFRRGDLVISVLRRASPDRAGTPDPATDALQAEWTASLAPLFERTRDENGRELFAHRVFHLE
jgi:L-rhamnose mutarotase